MGAKYDFVGWATKNNIVCSDGRIIGKDAFKDQDGQVVPLVWNHRHESPEEVIGHALLKNEDDGVRAYCSFNETQLGKTSKELVRHGDITSLSIWANKLKHDGSKVCHGAIREVSLVLAGANPGAHIESVFMAHGEECDDEAVIYSGEMIDTPEEKDEELHHADEAGKKEEPKKEESEMAEENKNSGSEETLQDVFNTLNEKQKKAVYAIIGLALQDKEGGKAADNDEEDEEMKHNVFDQDEEYMTGDEYLSHAEMDTIITDAKRYGSLKESFLAHAQEYGIDHIEYLFPDEKMLNNGAPEFIKRPDDWVSKVMNGVHHSPFSRIKSMFADITADDARAKGYMKGNLKKEEVFTLLKRSTTPTTIYKKQKIDRDDVVDITDFDVVSWLKTEMRMMLNEEIARAILFGDGRPSSSDDKINEQNVRPIVSDAQLYTIQATVTPANGESEAHAAIVAAIKSRKDYRGSGQPTLFTTEAELADMLLLEDTTGHRLYKTEAELATAMRVSSIVPVPDDIVPDDIIGVIVNLNDYNVGADKGGAVNMFDDFDIDYNQQKYLIETRISGALTKPYSAIVLKKSN